LDKPTTELDEIMEIMPAPDYPTSADIVSSKADIKQIYVEKSNEMNESSIFYRNNGC
jgi:topoisomerase-4 subunit A